MTEEIKRVIAEMEEIAEKAFKKVGPHLVSNEEMELETYGKMIDIAKDASFIMKNAAKIKYYCMEHPEKKI